MARLDQLASFQNSIAYMSEEQRQNQLSSSSFDRALFLLQHALKPCWKFLHQLHAKFKVFGCKIEGNLKSNLRRIARKIEELDEE